MGEIFDVYTREGEYIEAQPKSVCHSKNPGFYHKPVWIYIINSKNEILVQRRSSTKKRFPNLWGMSSGGHVNSGEEIIEGAIRETQEELGIKSKKENYILCREYIDDSSWEIAQVFVAHLDFDIKDVTLQTEEVSEVKWFTLDEFKKLLNSDEHVPLSNDYKEILLAIIENDIKKNKNEVDIVKIIYEDEISDR